MDAKLRREENPEKVCRALGHKVVKSPWFFDVFKGEFTRTWKCVRCGKEHFEQVNPDKEWS